MVGTRARPRSLGDTENTFLPLASRGHEHRVTASPEARAHSQRSHSDAHPGLGRLRRHPGLAGGEGRTLAGSSLRSTGRRTVRARPFRDAANPLLSSRAPLGHFPSGLNVTAHGRG